MSSAKPHVRVIGQSRVLYSSGAVVVVSATPACEAEQGASYSLDDLSLEGRLAYLTWVMVPLWEFYADIDDVFSEADALAPEKRQMGMGRAYRAWKRMRSVLDPDYDPEDDDRARTAGGVRRTYRPVLRPGGRAHRGRTLGA